ncbi:MAG: hypothetical protein A2X61_06900 [Ignavibacteria bacterium GWB2_35_12]|nr:MAG: hypothetical protein A2X61_06900 [Ignavibacteria bacterium GWB2_35_12]OGU87399.1 MAG: hypothetical protein A2220_01300 [Ignavibacteria bacterium RIFOXYA2_FULL_35_10]OGV22038.1 MAG: hypothetical protein A2475_09400 [Ignavibacteria bacterium RIFOXYC2_FULL_35_21]
MKRNRFFIYSFLSFIVATFSIYAQTGTYRVFFKDKGPVEFKQGSSLFDSTLKLFNERALKRRSKVLSQDSIINFEDAPVYKPYIDSCVFHGAEIKLKIRWKNYIVVLCDSLISENIKNSSFVKEVQPTGNKLTTLDYPDYTITPSIFVNDNKQFQYYENCNDYDYGPSYRQAQLMNIPLLHGFGINGKGVLIGFLDTGFRWKTHSSMGNASVLSEYDFVNNDSVTANENDSLFDQDHHGTAVFSTVSGFSQGNLIGIAPNADFLLAKTENLLGEHHIEEDNYAAGLEWLESLGVDVTSSSLGYFRFDSTDSNYTYDELNGRTTIVSQTVNNAVRRGVVCITAAGNSGPNTRTIISPADADSVIAVGAVQPDGKTPAGFTSRGPRFDGKMKPDVSAMGVDVYAATATEPYTFGLTRGTSLATPLVAGAVGLLMQEFPELKPWEVRSILLTTASANQLPDDTLGYGIPNIFNAMKKAGIIISPISTYKLNQYQRVVVYIVSSSTLINTELYVKFSDSQLFEIFRLYPTSYKYQFTADIPLGRFNKEIAECYVRAEDLEKSRRLPYYENEYISIEPYSNHIQCGIPASQTEEFAKDKVEAYVYPSIIEDSRNEIELIVPLKSKSEIKIELFNLLGQQIYLKQFSEREIGIASFPVPISNLSNGTYYIYVCYNGKSESIPFIIIKK